MISLRHFNGSLCTATFASTIHQKKRPSPEPKVNTEKPSCMDGGVADIELLGNLPAEGALPGNQCPPARAGKTSRIRTPDSSPPEGRDYFARDVVGHGRAASMAPR